LPALAIERFINIIFSKGHVTDGDELTLSLDPRRAERGVTDQCAQPATVFSIVMGVVENPS